MGYKHGSQQRPVTVGEAGEDHVLGRVRAVIDPFHAERPPMSVGLGDDAAVLTSAGHDPGQWVFTTDTVSEDQDFRSDWWMGSGTDLPALLEAPDQPPVEQFGADVGTKAAAQNLSDLNAMGATPVALLVSLSLPSHLPVTWVESFYRGVIAACAAPGAEQCVIAGGDLGAGEKISVSITAVGRLGMGEQPLVRSGAQPGDVLAVCGELGRAAAGLAVLESPQRAKTHYQDDGASLTALIRHCVNAQLRPSPPLGSGRLAVDAGAVAGMDLSDGLARDVPRIGAASGVSVQYHRQYLERCAVELLPVAQYLGLSMEAARQWVSTGGEDFGLLAVFPSDAELPAGFTVIGEVGAPQEGASAVPANASRDQLAAGGWDSLRG